MGDTFRVSKIVFSRKGFRQLLTGPEVTSDIRDRTYSVANAAGEGFEASYFIGDGGGGRVVGQVTAVDDAACRAEAEGKVLSTALDAGR